MKEKKGMSAALTLVIAAVILIVVAVLVLSVTTGGLGKFNLFSNKNTHPYIQAKAECSTCIRTYCAAHIMSSISDAQDFCDSCDGLTVECSSGAVSVDDSGSCGAVVTGKCGLTVTGTG